MRSYNHTPAYKEYRQTKRKTKEYKEYDRVYNAQPIRVQARADYKKTPEYQENQRVRWKEDPSFRISKLVANGVWFALGKNKGGRHWEDLVGYTVEQLRSHLERQFQLGMSWENYGKGGWVIDHKQPRCSFCFSSSDDPEFKACWALSNLQPLWEKDNLAKIGQDKQFSVRNKIRENI